MNPYSVLRHWCASSNKIDQVPRTVYSVSIREKFMTNGQPIDLSYFSKIFISSSLCWQLCTYSLPQNSSILTQLSSPQLCNFKSVTYAVHLRTTYHIPHNSRESLLPTAAASSVDAARVNCIAVFAWILKLEWRISKLNHLANRRRGYMDSWVVRIPIARPGFRCVQHLVSSLIDFD